jgi:hypothetical protein
MHHLCFPNGRVSKVVFFLFQIQVFSTLQQELNEEKCHKDKRSNVKCLGNKCHIPKKIQIIMPVNVSAVFSGVAGGARAPREFGGSQKGRSLISTNQSLAITMNTPGFENLNTALHVHLKAHKLVYLRSLKSEMNNP